MEGGAIGDLGEVINGLTYSPKDVLREGLLVIRSSNVKDGVLAYEDNVYVDKAIKGANLAMSGDIIICVRNGSKKLIGKNAMITNSNANGYSWCFYDLF